MRDIYQKKYIILIRFTSARDFYILEKIINFVIPDINLIFVFF